MYILERLQKEKDATKDKTDLGANKRDDAQTDQLSCISNSKHI